LALLLREGLTLVVLLLSEQLLPIVLLLRTALALRLPQAVLLLWELVALHKQD
jgi:hypothetical protein